MNRRYTNKELVALSAKFKIEWLNGRAIQEAWIKLLQRYIQDLYAKPSIKDK